MSGEAVLIVDDNPANLKLARVLLTAEGYEVRTAIDAVDTRRLTAHVADFLQRPLPRMAASSMPEMGGADLAARVQDLRPETRVLYMSGYTDDAVIRHKVLERETHFLQKPFTPASLARKVREALA